jgi:hypothetical protein
MNEDTNQDTGTRNMEPMEHGNGTQGTRTQNSRKPQFHGSEMCLL